MTACRSVILAAAAVVVAAGLLSPADAYVRPGRTERVTVASDGSQGIGPRSGPFARTALSSSGRYVVFTTQLGGLDPRDVALGQTDAFWRDRVTGRTELVAVNPRGLQAGPPLACFPPQLDAGVDHVVINGSGRQVAFETNSPDLAPMNGVLDTDCYDDVFVRDMITGAIERISVSFDGKQANEGSWNPAISADGRYVAFQSDATNLVRRQTDGAAHVYVRDRKKNKTELVDVSSSGVLGNANVGDAQVSISRNGRWVVFSTSASNLVNDDTNDRGDVFLRDLKTNKTERVSIGSNATEGSVVSGLCNVGRQAISNNGRYVVFCAGSPEFTPHQTPRMYDIYVRDRKTRRTERVSVSSAGEEGDSISSIASISGNGRVVAIGSYANNLVPGDTGQGTCFGPFPPAPQVCLPAPLGTGDADVFVHDVPSGATYMAAVAPNGTEPRDCQGSGFTTAFFPTLDNDGDTIGFVSCATNLVDGDTNLAYDHFVREIGRDLGTSRLSVAPANSSALTEGGLLRRSDATDDAVVAGKGAEIIGVTLAHRTTLNDLYLKIDVDRIPHLTHADQALPIVGDPAVLYGADLVVAGKTYQVRSSSGLTPLSGGFFSLFDCSGAVCTKLADLRGGYGTVGDAIVVSIPWDLLGAGSRVRIKEASVFSAIGTHTSGPVRILDDVSL